MAATTTTTTTTDSLPRGVSASTTGIFLFDVLALATMTACIPTLKVFAKKGRHWDLFTFGVAFAVAVAYHLCQMEPTKGLAGELWGVSGRAWRSLDILTAQVVLSRAFGHFISSRCYKVTKVVTEVGFPAAVASMCALGALAKAKEEAFVSSASSLASAAAASLSLGACSKALLCVVSSAVALKAALHAFHSRKETNEDKRRPFLPHAATPEGKARLWRAARSVALGLLLFPLPEFFPKLYFLFHSLWHLATARGFLCLYTLIEGMPEPARPAEAAAAALGAVGAAAAEVAAPVLVSLSSCLSSSFSSSSSSSSSSSTASFFSSRGNSGGASARQQQRQRQRSGHRRVLSVVFEGNEGEEEEEEGEEEQQEEEVVVLEDEEEEEETTSSASASSSSSGIAAVGEGEISSCEDDDDHDDEGGEEEQEARTTSAAETSSSSSMSTSASSLLSLKEKLVSSSSSFFFLCGGRGAFVSSPSSSSSSSSSPFVNVEALGTKALSSFLRAWASGGAPSMSSALRASFVKRHLDAARALPGGAAAAARKKLVLLGSGGSSSDGGGGGGGRRVVLLRRRRFLTSLASAASNDD